MENQQFKTPLGMTLPDLSSVHGKTSVSSDPLELKVESQLETPTADLASKMIDNQVEASDQQIYKFCYNKSKIQVMTKVITEVMKDDIFRKQFKECNDPNFKKYLTRYEQIEEEKEEKKKKTSSRTKYIHYTVSPPHDYEFNLLQDFIENLTKSEAFQDMIWTYEVTNNEEPYHYHVHILVKRFGQPSDMTKKIKSKYNTVYGYKPRARDPCLCVKSVDTDTYFENCMKYLVGIDVRPDKMDSHIYTEEWRNNFGIEPYYFQGNIGTGQLEEELRYI